MKPTPVMTGEPAYWSCLSKMEGFCKCCGRLCAGQTEVSLAVVDGEPMVALGVSLPWGPDDLARCERGGLPVPVPPPVTIFHRITVFPLAEFCGAADEILAGVQTDKTTKTSLIGGEKENPSKPVKKERVN